ncbi:MAG: DNA translocase FtsK 4TM domain-containing protein [Alphaproteobacteria bacterium]|nr:DNA translocase FtsK 4TM domain-containing protein [Alphaproteobacteria bacterium]
MGKKKIVKERKKSWWQILLCNLFGLIFICLPLFAYASLCGYHADDPSFNKAVSATATVHNFLGKAGAYTADAILSSFGLALIVFLIVPLFWGIGLWRYKAFAEYKTRIFAWIVGVLSFSCFLDLTCRAYLGRFGLPYNLAGEWGRSISRPLNNYISILNTPYNTLLLEGIILFVSILSFNFSAGVTLKFWSRLIYKVGTFIKAIFSFILGTGKKIAKIPDFRGFKELQPGYLQNKLHGGLGNAPVHREPTFSASASALQQVRATEEPVNVSAQRLKTVAADGNKAVKQTPRLTIEMPQSYAVGESTAIDTSLNSVGAGRSSANNFYSPTFDFIKDEAVANQNQKKTALKMSPDDIYKTEGVKKAAKNKVAAPEAVQEELLAVPSGPQGTAAQTVQSQIAAGSSKAKVEIPQKKVAQPVAEKEDKYVLPSIDLMTPRQSSEIVVDEEALQNNAAQLEQSLRDFGIKGQIVKVRPGPVVTLYELEPAPGIRTARVIGLADDIARSMAAMSTRMAVVSGQKTIGIELPNANRQTVWLRELFENEKFMNSKNLLNVALGKDIGGQPVYADLAGMPHLLVAGTTGSGKSVGVNSMILSLLYRMTPEQCKFIMIDPKCVEFSMYNGIPHLLTPVITDPAKAVVGLKWAVQEMESRNRSLALLNVRNITGYNKKVEEIKKSGKGLTKTIQTGFDKETGRPVYEEQTIDTSPMPYIVIVVDEMADLMLVAGKDVEAAIQRLAQMGRAVGIHLIMATQRPSVDVITGVIKANFPSRISFHVTNKFDSTTIIGEKGAEQLLGRGDMLFMASGDRPRRVHGCYIEDAEVERIVDYIKSQGEPQYKAEVTAGELNNKDGADGDKGEASGDAEEDLYRQAVDIVRTDRKASTSYVQRKLRIGYNRAANLIERMEQEGIVSRPDHVGRREILS